MKAYLICLMSLLTLSGALQAQFDANWTLDSMILRFDYNGPVSLITASITDGVQLTSISDREGNLQYYSNYGSFSPNGYGGMVINRKNEIISNGSGINMSRTPSGSCFLPFEGTDKLGFLTFSVPSGGIRAWYHLIDTIQNSIIKKNILLNPGSMIMKFGSAPVRHANGRDWWLILHNIFGREFIVYQCTPDTVLMDSIYTYGGYLGSDGNYVGFGAGGGFLVNSSGNKVYHYTIEGLVEELNFNRCTGLLKFGRTLLPQINDNSALHYYAALSPNDRYLYLVTDNWVLNSQGVYQYDLFSSNIINTRYVVYGGQNQSSINAEWILKAPDNKIYFCTYPIGLRDSSYLNVIANPDFGGVACNLSEKYIYIGVRIPNYTQIFPSFSNYYLGAIPNSQCDTLGLSKQNLIHSPQIDLYPNPATEKIYLDWPDGPSHFTLRIFDSSGKLMHQECMENTGKQSIPLIKYPAGIYMLQVEDERGRRINRRFGVRGE